MAKHFPLTDLIGTEAEVVGFRDQPDHGLDFDLGYLRTQKTENGEGFGNIAIADESTKEALNRNREKSDGTKFAFSEGPIGTVPMVTVVTA